MNGQFLMNKAISVQYAFKKDGKGERHGTAAERLLAAQARKNNALPVAARPPPAPMGFGARPAVPGFQGYQGQFAGALASAPPPAPPPGFTPQQTIMPQMGMGMAPPVMAPQVGMQMVPPPPPPGVPLYGGFAPPPGFAFPPGPPGAPTPPPPPQF